MTKDYTIKEITIKFPYYITYIGNQYPTVQLYHSEKTDTINQQTLSEGWIYQGYNERIGVSNYYKEVDLRSQIDVVEIVFEKKADARDKEAFGFEEDYLIGGYQYDIKEELKEDISQAIWNNLVNHYFPQGKIDVNCELGQKIIACYPDIIEDEYEALLQIRDTKQSNRGAVYVLESRAYYVLKKEEPKETLQFF